MKYSQLLLGGVLLAALLFLAACSSQPTQTPIVNDTPTNLGTDQIPVNVSPETVVPIPNSSTEVGFDDLSVPKVRVTSIDALGSRFDAKYMFNQIVVNFTSDIELDWTKFSVYVGNKYYNRTLEHNATIACTKVTDLIKNRNGHYATQGSSTKGSICFSPARDLATPDSVDVVGTYDGTVVLSETVKIPSVVVKTIVNVK